MTRSCMTVIDAHQHFWNLDENYYPWLCDAEPVPFRYGDYSALRQTYLPPDYRRDSVAFQVVKTVHMEAEWDRADPVAETRWIERIHRKHGLPSACIGHAEFDRADVAEVLAGHARSPLMRGIRHKPKAAGDPRDTKRGAPGSMDDPRWRAGYALLERHGPRHRRRATECFHQDFRARPPQRALDARGQRTDHPRDDRHLRRRPLHVRQQLSGRPPRGLLRYNLRGLFRRRRRSADRRAVAIVPRQRPAHLSPLTRRNIVCITLFKQAQTNKTTLLSYFTN